MSTLLDLSTDGPSIREGAGFWVRALARVIDTLVHTAVGLAAGLAMGILVAIGSALQGIPGDESIQKLSATTPLAFLAALIGDIALHAVAEALHGSTVGKRICGLTVISEDGTPATLPGALKRSIVYASGTPCSSVWSARGRCQSRHAINGSVTSGAIRRSFACPRSIPPPGARG